MTPLGSLASAFDRAAELINTADGLLICAGAGIGVDSGLPDFRGTAGFWKAYPALRAARIDFTSIASPGAFHAAPRRAWGFYGHRLNLYRDTLPHRGFEILRRIGASMPRRSFVFTSNVDGQFQKAGFDPGRVVECHGSIHFLQCMTDCRGAVWSADAFVPEVDQIRCELVNDLPACPHCGGLARPNILMFGDPHWIGDRTGRQERALRQWRGSLGQPVVVIEIGAGTHVPSVRMMSESMRALIIRINPSESRLPFGTDGVSIALGGLAALDEIAQRLDA